MFINSVIGQLPGFIFGVVASLIIVFGSGFIKEYFNERNRKAKHKRDVARQVLKICNEASTGNFRRAPRDIEHINSILTDLEGVDEEMSVKMEKFVNSWVMVARKHSKGRLSSDDVKFTKDSLDHAEKKRKILIAWANKIRVGKKFRAVSVFFRRTLGSANLR